VRRKTRQTGNNAKKPGKGDEKQEEILTGEELGGEKKSRKTESERRVKGSLFFNEGSSRSKKGKNPKDSRTRRGQEKKIKNLLRKREIHWLQAESTHIKKSQSFEPREISSPKFGL